MDFDFKGLRTWNLESGLSILKQCMCVHGPSQGCLRNRNLKVKSKLWNEWMKILILNWTTQGETRLTRSPVICPREPPLPNHIICCISFKVRKLAIRLRNSDIRLKPGDVNLFLLIFCFIGSKVTSVVCQHLYNFRSYMRTKHFNSRHCCLVHIWPHVLDSMSRGSRTCHHF